MSALEKYDRCREAEATQAPAAECRVGSLRLSEFAVPNLEGPGTETSIVLAADNADPSPVPAKVVVFWPDEIVVMYQDGGINWLLWEVKRHFGPQLRSDPIPS